MTSQELKETTNSLAEDGWLPVDVNVMEMSGGTWLAGLHRKTGDARMVHWGMTSADPKSSAREPSWRCPV